MMCPGKNSQDSPQGEEILIEYCSGTLDEARTVQFEQHLAECAECTRLVAAQRAAFEALDAWEPAEISADFDRRLYAKIAQEDAEPAWKRWLTSLWKPALVTAAAGAALAVVMTVGIVPGEKSPIPQRKDAIKQVRSEIVDIDQMENALEELDLLTPLPETSRM